MLSLAEFLSNDRYVTIYAVGGLFLAVLASEICSRPGVHDNCAKSNMVVLGIKAVCSILTAAQVIVMLRQMELRTEYFDTQKTLIERGRGMKVHSKAVEMTLGRRITKSLKQHWFLIFVLLPFNIIHPVPGVSFTVVIPQLGIHPKYRVESLVAGLMLPRVYHVFVFYKLKLLTSLLSLDSSLIVRNEGAIRQLNDPGLSQPQLAFKIALERQPIRIITTSWLVLGLFATCLIRVFESTEGSDFSIYFWDQLWCVLVTATTTGYGSNPPSHMSLFLLLSRHRASASLRVLVCGCLQVVRLYACICHPWTL